MILQNYYNMLNGLLKNKDVSLRKFDGSYVSVPPHMYVNKTTNNLSLVNLSSALAMASPGSNTSTTTTCMLFGSGDTAPTANDYKLSNLITTISGSRAVTTDENVTTVTFSVTNTGTSEISIKELGLLVGYYDSSKYHQVLLDRTVLETPVIIPASGVGQVVYSLTFE